MSFSVKKWANRKVQYPGRYILKNTTSGASQTVDMIRDEGTVQTEGDAVSETNMNDLENRISSEFINVNNSIDTINPKINLPGKVYTVKWDKTNAQMTIS